MNFGKDMTINERVSLLKHQVENISAGWKTIMADVDVMYSLFEQIDMMRAALRPFADAVNRNGLIDPMTDKPLDDNAKAGLMVRVCDWRRAADLVREKQGVKNAD